MEAVGALARRMPSAAPRCWTSWCQAALLGASALVMLAERSACKWARRPLDEGDGGRGGGGGDVGFASGTDACSDVL